MQFHKRKIQRIGIVVGCLALAVGLLCVAWLQPLENSQAAGQAAAAQPRLQLIGQVSEPSRCVAVANGHVFFGSQKLFVASLDDPTHPQVIGDFTPPSGNGFCNGDLAVAGNRGYTANLFEVGVYDLSDLAHPAWLAYPNMIAERITVSGTYAYAAASTNGLGIFDIISDPANPSVLIEYRPAGMSAINDVAIAGSYAYLPDSAGYGDPNALRIVDLHDPRQPQMAGIFTGTSGASRFYGVAVAYPLVYLVDVGGSLRILDVSTPTQPVQVGALTFAAGRYPRRVAVSGAYAYITDDFNTLHVLDISDPGQPTVVEAYDCGAPLYDVVTQGDSVYVATESSGNTRTGAMKILQLVQRRTMALPLILRK